MLTLRENIEVHFCLLPIDMRKSIDGLSALVVDFFECSPQIGNVFVFYNKPRNKIKMLLWDRNGFVLYYKRLERGRFKLKDKKDGSIVLTHDQLNWLLAGLDFTLMHDFSELNYRHYY